MFNKSQRTIIKNIMSSYNKNKASTSGNYGNLFYSITTLCNPRLAVEIGVCKGYSTIHIAKGIKDCGGLGKLKCFDLWESDSLKSNFHESQRGLHLTSSNDEMKKVLKALDLDSIVELNKLSAFEVLRKFDNESIDMLHVDIGNCGKTLEKIIPEVFLKIRKNGYFLYEGGALYRDSVNWMKRFEKKSISDVLHNSHFFSNKFEYLTFEEYPSLTVCKKIASIEESKI